MNVYKAVSVGNSSFSPCTHTHIHTYSDDAPVDMDALVSVIMRYQNGLISAEAEPEELECCPTCRSCGLLPYEAAHLSSLNPNI